MNDRQTRHQTLAELFDTFLSRIATQIDCIIINCNLSYIGSSRELA